VAAVLLLITSSRPRADELPAGASTDEKPGRLMLNLKTGYEPIPFFVGLTLQLELGIAVDARRRAYILVQIEGDPFSGSITVPVGFQYDFRVSRRLPIYVYPRLLFGYWRGLIETDPNTFGNGLQLSAGVGIKRVLGAKHRFNVGGELIGGFVAPLEKGPMVEWSFLPILQGNIYFGVNF
jgi:hypothetical protein